MIAHDCLRVGVLGMDERSRNLLRLFFDGPCKGACELVDHDRADVTLIDLDAYGGSNLKAKHDALYPDRQVILLSIQPKPAGDVLWLSKPLNGKLLLNTLTDLRTRITSSRPPPAPSSRGPGASRPVVAAAPVSRKVDPAPLPPKRARAGVPAVAGRDAHREPARPPVAQLSRSKVQEDRATTRKVVADTDANDSGGSGDAAAQLDEVAHLRYLDKGADINPTDPAQVARVSFSTDNLLQGYLQRALSDATQTNRPVVVSGIWRSISIDPLARSVCYELSLSQLRSLCIMPTKESEVSIQPLVIPGGDAPNRHTGKFDHQPLDAFLWQIALWTSRGRIPNDADLKKPVFLSHWPNFTRLTVTPHALRIAALWSRQPYGLIDTAKILHIPQRYVFAFFCAVQAIGLARQGQRRSDVLLEQSTPVESRHKGLLGRILSRLRGK